MVDQALAAWETYADALLDNEILALGPTADDPLQEAVLRRLGESGLDDKAKKRITRRLEDADEALSASIADPTTPYDFVVWNAGLDAVAARVLALAAAIEIEPSRQRVARVLAGTQAGGASQGLVRRLFGEAGVASVLPDGGLSRTCLLEPVETAGPWSSQALHVARPVVAAFLGAAHRDDDLPADAVLVWDSAVDPEGDGFVLVSGGDQTSRRRIGMERVAGSRFVVTPLPSTEREWRAVVRHCAAFGCAAICETDGNLDSHARHWIDRSPVSIVLASRRQVRVDALPEREFVEFTVPAAEGVDPETGHHIDAEQRRLAQKALPSVGGDLDAALRRVATGHLDSFAVRTTPGRSWNELVLPESQLAQLGELVERYRHRSQVYHRWGFTARPSTGVTALFSGPSGTGKTMTAEIVATDLGLDLYRVDLSAVVSKYIGETEKNLESVFAASSAGNLVLFFDEADALFGKRTEVSDARDRYANIETSYLLQRLERYEGVVILATNLRNNIDSAFLRRVDLSVEFEMPDERHRRRIWEVVFPKVAPLDGVDFDVLAGEFEMSGGAIRNAAVHSAFLAAAGESSITMDHVLTGVQREFQKEGRLRTQADARVAAIRGGAHVSATG